MGKDTYKPSEREMEKEMGRDLQEKRTNKEGPREGAKGRQNRRSRWKMKGFSGTSQPVPTEPTVPGNEDT